MEQVLQYVMRASDAVDKDDIRTLARELGPETEGLAMTLAERLWEEGREEVHCSSRHTRT